MNEKENTNVLLSYSPSDFFYVKADFDGIMPNSEQCDAMDVYNTSWDISCNSKYYTTNADICFRKELCKNKEKVDFIKKNEDNNNGANQKYLDVKNKYDETFLSTVNLGIGILLVTAFIIKNTYVSI